MKLRNRLLALVLILVFAGVGLLYFRTWVVQKPFGIILFVSDSLIPSNLAAARLYAGGSDHRLALESFPSVAMLRNASLDFAIPDAAAAATALATGVRTKNREIALDPSGKPLESILTIARKAGRQTGIVTNGLLVSPSVAPFYANAGSRDDLDAIAAQLFDTDRVDVMMGGGRGYFYPEAKGGKRKDERDLLIEIRRASSHEARTREELENLQAWSFPRVFGLFSDKEMVFRDQHPQSEIEPSLSQMTRRAIEMLQTHQGGYLLVVNAGLVRDAAATNQGERMLTELLELDAAVKTARTYAGEKSLVIVAGTTATGGLRLNGYPFSREQGVALLGTNAFGLPSLTWSTGPNGPKDLEPASTEPAAFFTPEAANVAADVLTFGAGPGSETLTGILDNTMIFSILREKL